MINICYMLPSISSANGISSFVFNYIDSYDKSKYHISIIANEENASQHYIEYCKENDIELVLLPNFKSKGIKKYKSALKSFFKNKENMIDVFHCNVTNQGALALKYAKKYNVKVRILHSHATKGSDNKIKALINDILAIRARQLANTYFACSTEAGNYLFKNKKFNMIYNAVDISKYKYSSDHRVILRKKYSIDDNTKVIGFVGRFARQKNILYIVDIALAMKEENVIFILIGNGDLKDELLSKITLNNLNNKFIILDELSDVSQYYSMFDCFILPSLYEGLPVVAIEAQLNSLPVLLSYNISKETIISSTAKILSLTNVLEWKEEIIKADRNKVVILENNFDIIKERKKYFILLEELLKDCK